MRGIGYFLGATFGAALVFYLISFIFLRPRNVDDIEVKQFIQNSDRILITNPVPFLSKYDGDEEKLGSDLISKTTYFSNKNMTYIYAGTYTYYSKELNKFIRTYYISGNGVSINSTILDFGDKDKDKEKYPDLYFYYNKTQNADPSYGTIDKPLPILFFESSDPIKKTFWYDNVNQEKDVKLMNNIYENNVKLYLQYFIEKEDFKKLFPNS